MTKMGRPLTREVDFDFIKKLIDKGFTISEASEILKLPIDTMQYYARTRKLGKFSRYRKGTDDDRIMITMKACGESATEASKILGIAQPKVWIRYKVINDNKRAKESRFRWLKKNYPTLYQDVKGVVKD